MVSLLNNRYKPEKILGHGGMGKVYLMTDTHIQQRVAVKECFISQTEEHIVERIKREYYFMTKIEHENLVKGLDFFYDKNRYFIVMEYVEGITLSDFLRQGEQCITFDKQLQIAAQICDAVAALNENDIIHRDIKPENIILTPSDLRPKLLDFGVAKAVNGELVTITKTSNIIGTPTYMTPEQIDPRIEMRGNLDVFSLGIVFYQFLAWMPQSPFYAGQIVSTLDRIVNKELPLLFSETQDTQKKYISQVIAWALRKNPRERITSVKELQRLLSVRNEKQMNETLPQNTTSVDSESLVSSLEPVKKTLGFFYLRIALLLVVNGIFLILLYYKTNTSLPVNTERKSQRIGIISSSALPVVDYTPDLVEFATANLHRELPSYERGLLLYRMREKNHEYKNQAIAFWRKDTKSIMARYQLFYIGMIDFIVGKKSTKTIADLYSESKGLIADLQKFRNKSPSRLKALKNCRHFQEILEIITVHQKVSQKRQKVTSLFEKNLQANGFGNMFLAYHDDTRINQKLAYLHLALSMIPEEELVYTKLIEIYSEFGFHEKVVFLRDYLHDNINPHLLSPDIAMINTYLHQGKMSKAKQLFDKLAHYKIFSHSHVQISWCEYHFLTGNVNTARIILQDLAKRRLFDKELMLVEGLKIVLHQQLENKSPVAVLKAIRLSILKGDFVLAARYIRHVESMIVDPNSNLKNAQLLRIQSRLYRVKLLLYINDHTQKNFDVSISTIRSLSGQFISITNVFRSALKRNMPLGKEHVQLLKQRSDAYTFCSVYADYLFRSRKYGLAIIYWQKAMHLVPNFRDYFAQKQDQAWQLRSESR